MCMCLPLEDLPSPVRAGETHKAGGAEVKSWQPNVTFAAVLASDSVEMLVG